MSTPDRHLTYMFCDLAGAEGLPRHLSDPEAAFEIIHGFQRACAGQVESHQGYVARNMGDAVLAYFGYPVPLACNAMAAVRCALAMRDLVCEMPGALQIRAGIANGRGVLEELQLGTGTAELSVVSDATNLAARLEAQAEPGEILISQQVYEWVKDRVVCSGPREVMLKGYLEPQPTYAVLALR